MLCIVYCFYKNNIYQKHYGNLIFILGFIIIITPCIIRYFFGIIFSNQFIVHIYPACLICLSTIVNYFTYKKYNEY